MSYSRSLCGTNVGSLKLQALHCSISFMWIETIARVTLMWLVVQTQKKEEVLLSRHLKNIIVKRGYENTIGDSSTT